MRRKNKLNNLIKKKTHLTCDSSSTINLRLYNKVKLEIISANPVSISVFGLITIKKKSIKHKTSVSM